jgi:uncharacterized protein with beta-barrel porin domain
MMARRIPINGLKFGASLASWTSLALCVASANLAEAGCAPTTFGPRDFSCSGTITTGVTLANPASLLLSGASVRPFAGGGVSMTGNSGTNIGFAMDATSSIAARNGDALTLTTQNANILSIAPALRGIGGTISAQTGLGVNAFVGGLGSIQLSTTATIGGAAGGVRARAEGGSVTLDLGGQVSSQYGKAVDVNAGAGAATITYSEAITGAQGGISAAAHGLGDVTISGSGALSGGTGVGLAATAEGGSIDLRPTGAVTGAQGIAASTASGAINIALKERVTGATGVGISATTDAGDITVDLARGAYVTGATAGLRLQSGGGAVAVTNAGVIEGTTAAIIANSGSGALNIGNTGTINGSIIGVRADVVNSGAWRNAGQSQIGSLNNTGVLQLSATGGSLANVAVTGNAVFGAGSMLGVRLAPIAGATASDTIYIGGAAQLGGALQLTGAAANLPVLTQIRFLEAAGGVSGAFSSVVSSLPSFAGVVGYDATGAYITLVSREFRQFALTRNQYNVANAIWAASGQLTNSGAGLLLGLNLAAPRAIPGALDQLSGEGALAADAAAQRTGEQFTAALADQQASWRGDDNRAYREIPYRATYGGPRKGAYARPVVADDNRWRVWGGANGARQSNGADSGVGAAANSANMVGGRVGLDYQIGTSLLMGAALGYSNINFASPARATSGGADAVQVGGYTGFRAGGFHLATSLAWSGFSNHVSRDVTGLGPINDRLTSAFKSNEVRGRIEMGQRLTAGALAVTPFAAIEIAKLRTQNYIESASFAGASTPALSYAARAARSTPTFIGLRIESRLAVGEMRLTPWASIAWRHEWASHARAEASFVSLPGASFLVYGAQTSRDSLQARAGFELGVTRLAALFVAFEGDFSQKTRVYGGKAGVKVAW